MTRTLRLFVALALSARVAAAEDPDAERTAKKLYDEGNVLFSQKAYPAAIEKYKAALAHSDSAYFRYNLAVAQIQLERWIDALDNLEIALRSVDEFPAEARQHLNDYHKLLIGRVGTLEVTCSKSASVQIDGNRWFDCPGTKSMRVLAGEHSIVAEAKEYATRSIRVVVAGGTTTRERVALVPLSDVQEVYPTRPWVPWTTLAVGVAIGLGGVGVYFSADRDMERFDERFAKICVPGCSENLDATEIERGLAEQRDDAYRKGQIGIGLMVTGGVLGLAGAVWVGLNRPTRVVPSVEASGQGVTARATWRF